MPRFNPSTGEWEGLEPPSLPRRNTPPTYSGGGSSSTAINMPGRGATRSSSHRSLFATLNGAVAAIGNMLADFYDFFRGKISTVITWLLWMAGIGGLISLTLDGHWIIAIIAAVTVGAIYYYMSIVVAAIASWLLFLPVAVLRFIFYNIWTLLVAAAIAFAAWAGNSGYLDGYTNYDTVAQEEAIPCKLYTVDAWVLNVRDQPDITGNVIGTLEKNDDVYVTDLYAGEGFAAIDFGGQQGFVSRKYISRQ